MRTGEGPISIVSLRSDANISTLLADVKAHDYTTFYTAAKTTAVIQRSVQYTALQKIKFTRRNAVQSRCTTRYGTQYCVGKQRGQLYMELQSDREAVIHLLPNHTTSSSLQLKYQEIGAGLSYVHSVHAHRRPHHRRGPTTRQT